MICQIEILDFAEKDEGYETQIIWACHELISLMYYLKKGQEYKDRLVKQEIADCVRLIITLFFPQLFLKGELEDDYFMFVEDEVSDLSEENKTKIMSCYHDEFILSNNSDIVMKDKYASDLDRNHYNSFN